MIKKIPILNQQVDSLVIENLNDGMNLTFSTKLFPPDQIDLNVVLYDITWWTDVLLNWMHISVNVPVDVLLQDKYS